MCSLLELSLLVIVGFAADIVYRCGARLHKDRKIVGQNSCIQGGGGGAGVDCRCAEFAGGGAHSLMLSIRRGLRMPLERVKNAGKSSAWNDVTVTPCVSRNSRVFGMSKICTLTTNIFRTAPRQFSAGNVDDTVATSSLVACI